ncbi:NACHT domain-containing protein [Streptomyces sp. NBC_01537]|uniref:NACHT domain-containing protein n=1 Tax=Streptomyces sp. NBC_01537 TaxID=2903896 RepID=UPI00386F42CF
MPGPGPDPVRERIAAVFSGGRQGSGYLLTPRLVLTADHVIADGEDIRVAVPGGLGPVECESLYSWRTDNCDIALLFAKEDLGRFPETPMRWGRPTSLAPIRDCQAIGFPHVQRGPDGKLDTEQLVGTFKPGSGLLGGRYVLDSDHTPPVPRPDGGSPWAGMSGAAVFSDGVFVGVITTDPHGWQHGRVEVTAAHVLLDNTRFAHELAYFDFTPVVVTPPGQPTDPDTDFEVRLADYTARRHGTLTIFGVDLSDSSRAEWPLDAAYLSLEAAASDRRAGEYSTARAPAPPQPADQALAGHDRVLLRGVAGSGKTTLVQWLAVCAARQDLGEHLHHLRDRIPFVLPLRTLIRREELPAPAFFLSAVRNPLAEAQPPGWASRVLAAGRALLLIDGIDEIPEPDRERVRVWLRDLLAAFPGNLWLVTSRPSAVADSWLAADGFTELTLSPMSRDDITAFVARWHAAVRTTVQDPDERSRLAAYETSLLAALRTKQDLGRLATNPLMCGLISALHRDRRGYLPHGRKELYDAALSMLLARRDRERDLDVQLTEEPQIQLLQKLAYWLIRNGQAEMDRADALDLIAAALPAMPAVAALGNARQVYDHFLLRSGLLREPADGTVDFVHRTFQDYLGAKAAVEERDFDLMVRNAHHDQWEDVIRLAVAHARPAERARLLRKLIARGDRTKSHRTRLHLLATACLEHATELDPAVRTEVEQRAAALIPPRSYEDAGALAAAGPVVLELLPGPEGLTYREAELVVAAASFTASDAAIPLLARFLSHTSAVVQAQLATSWPRFDTVRYGTEIIARLPEGETYFVAQSPLELDILHSLGGRPNMAVNGAFGPDRLLAGLSTGRLAQLALQHNPELDGLALIAGLPGLRGLRLKDCPRISDLSPLAALSLDSLSLEAMPGVAGLQGLSALTKLRGIEIQQHIPGTSLTALPRAAPLTFLKFTTGALLTTGLRGLAHWPTLERLSIASTAGELAPSDWAEAAALPALTVLTLDGGVINGPLAAISPWPLIQHLHLYDITADDNYAALPRCFPGLLSLSVLADDDRIEAAITSALPNVRLTRF